MCSKLDKIKNPFVVHSDTRKLNSKNRLLGGKIDCYIVVYHKTNMALYMCVCMYRIINPQRACTRGLQYSVCMSVSHSVTQQK